MKKLYTLAAGLFALCLASCSSEEPTPNPAPVNPGEGNYIAINLFGTGSRAETAGTETGTAQENIVTDARFFFFDAEGNPVNVNSDNNMTSPISLPGYDAGSSLVLVTPNEDGNGYSGTIPARIVCVANLANFDAYVNKSLAEVSAIISDKIQNGDDFIMTSAATWIGDQHVFWAEIKPENVCQSIEDAMATPVTVRLERLAAKVSVESDCEDTILEGTHNFYELVNGEIVASVKKVAIRPIGWKLVNTTSSCYAIKHLTAACADLLGTPWAGANQSTWASTIHPDIAISEKFAPTFSANFGTSEYIFENTASTEDATKPATKVIVGAEIYLVDTDATGIAADATAAKFLEWGGDYYTVEALFHALGSYAGADICGVAEENMYVSFFKAASAADANKILNASAAHGTAVTLPKAKYYNGGCYYISTIASGHTDKAENALAGVVRNTIYKVTINTVGGIGTPVIDPENPVEPIDSEISESIVSATLKVLDWNIANAIIVDLK